MDELQHLVAAIPRIRVLGTAHSFNRIADTDSDLVSVAGLPAAIAIDTVAGTVDVDVRYGELGTELQAHGWALHNLGSLPHISGAGACSTGTYGSGDAHRCLAAAAVAVETVAARRAVAQPVRRS